MDGKLIVFDDLVRCVIDGDATAEEFQDFVEMMRDDPALQGRYCRQMQIHALLTCHKGQAWPEEGEILTGDFKPGAAARPSRAGVPASHRTVWWMAAAAAVLLLGGIAVWQSNSPTSDLRLLISDLRSLTSDLRSPIPGLRPRTSVSPVKLVSQSGVKGLDLPEALPGRVRLESGAVVVRLGSDVELTVLGPADLDILDCMQVRLERGRLLANVPHWATGFVVFTADLEVCDLGTVFGVSVRSGPSPVASEKVSDVFVFKGSVQVNESREREWGASSSGGNVRICKAGEGVRLIDGERPVKITADGTVASRLLESVRDQAAEENPAAALAAAEKIADLWVDRYMPEKSSQAIAQRLAAALALKVPFRKTAWVRSSASLQQEESNMNKTSAAAVLTAAAVMMGAGTSGAVSEPVLVDLSPHTDNGRWTTVFTNAVPLQWDWPATAASAKLSIVGMNGSVVTNFTEVTSNWLWRAFASDVPSAEDTYSLTLTFYGSGETVVGALTSRLSVVTGAFGETPVNPDPSDPKWAKVKENVLIPYDAGWTAATADAAAGQLVIAKAGGATQTNALADAGGYFGWKLKHSEWGYGTFALALTFPGTEGVWEATLMRPVDGTMIRMQ